MNNLQAGIEAYKAGDKEEAEKYFKAALNENPKDVNAWGWLYQTTTNPDMRIACLKRILEIDPANEKASQELNRIRPARIIPPPTQQINPDVKPVQPTKKSNNTLLLLGLGTLVIFGCCILFALFSSSTDSQVRYVISGSASGALITYFNETGGTEQVEMAIPFTKEFSASPGSPLSLVAQNFGSGSITCEIWIDGTMTKTSTSTAEFGVVTCADFAQ